jgi:hypothetical protein
MGSTPHHAQDAVDAEPGVPEAGVGVVHIPFGPHTRSSRSGERATQGPTDHRVSAVAGTRTLRAAANQLATAGCGLPDPSGEGWHRVQKVLEALRAHEQNLGIGGDDGDAGLASCASQ